MIYLNDLTEIGVVRKPHGTTGELDVYLKRDLPEDAECVMLLIDNIPVPFYIAEWRYKSGESLLLKLEDVNTETAAKRLAGCKVYVEKTKYDDDEADLLAWSDMRGYMLIDPQGREIGVVEDVDESTINTLFLLSEGAVIPAHEDFILSIDIKNRQLTVQLPEGLLE